MRASDPHSERRTISIDTDQRLNGWDLQALQDTDGDGRSHPESGRLTWRGRVNWVGHFGMDAHAEAIEQLGETIPRRFTLRGDHPPELLGENTGPTAVETLLTALGSCVAGTYAAHATANGVRLTALEVRVESAIDLNGFLQLAPTPAGLDGARVTVRVRSDADDAHARGPAPHRHRTSPGHDRLTRAVAVHSAIERP